MIARLVVANFIDSSVEEKANSIRLFNDDKHQQLDFFFPPLLLILSSRTLLRGFVDCTFVIISLNYVLIFTRVKMDFIPEIDA